MNYTDIINNIITNINCRGYDQNDYQRFEDEYGWASWMEDYCEGEDPTEREIEEINEVLKDAWNRAFENPLHRIRKEANLTQKQLSEASGVHINIISRIERGERSSDKLTLDTAARLAKTLGCHAEDLLNSQPSEGYNILKEWRDSHNVTQKEFLETYANNEQRYTSELRSIEKGIAKTFSRKTEAEDHRNK